MLIGFGNDSLADQVVESQVTAAERDFVSSEQPGTLAIPVTNGRWQVEVLMGDVGTGHDDMKLVAEGELIHDDIDARVTEFVWVGRGETSESPIAFEVEVADEVLELEFSDLGGGNAEWVVNAITLKPLAGDPKSSSLDTLRYDLGTKGSPVAPDSMRLTEVGVGETRWSTKVKAIDRNPLTFLLWQQRCRELAEKFLAGEITIAGMPESQNQFHYRLYVPPNIEQGKTYPLLVWLNGHGENGNDNYLHLRWLKPWFFYHDLLDRHSFFVLAVQCPEDVAGWTTSIGSGGDQPKDMLDVTLRVVDELKPQHPIDKNRVVLSGISAGGTAAWTLGARSPETFSAVVPLASSGLPEGAATPLSKTVVWAFHNQGDKSPIEPVIRTIKELKAAGGSAHLTAYEVGGHIPVTFVYPGYEVAEWMFEKKRGQPSWWLPPGVKPSEFKRIFSILKFAVIFCVVAVSVSVVKRRVCRQRKQAALVEVLESDSNA